MPSKEATIPKLKCKISQNMVWGGVSGWGGVGVYIGLKAKQLLLKQSSAALHFPSCRPSTCITFRVKQRTAC